VDPLSAPSKDGSIFNRYEEIAIALRNARYQPVQIARELGISQADLERLFEGIDAKLAQITAKRRTPDPLSLPP
jgi:hypothetical protein